MPRAERSGLSRTAVRRQPRPYLVAVPVIVSSATTVCRPPDATAHDMTPENEPSSTTLCCHHAHRLFNITQWLRVYVRNFSKTQGGLNHHPAQPVAWRA